MPKKNQLSDVERFIHPEPMSGCWLWRGGTTRKLNGYGQFWMDNRLIVAHRAVYEYYKGPIPPNLTLDHKCRVRMCVNPDHLEPVTMRENNLRGNGMSGINARKTHCKHGHELIGDNLIVRRDGRECRTCSKIYKLAWYLKNKRRAA